MHFVKTPEAITSMLAKKKEKKQKETSSVKVFQPVLTGKWLNLHHYRQAIPH